MNSAWEVMEFFLHFCSGFPVLPCASNLLNAFLLCLRNLDDKQPLAHSSCPEKYLAVLGPLKAAANQKMMELMGLIKLF